MRSDKHTSQHRRRRVSILSAVTLALAGVVGTSTAAFADTDGVNHVYMNIDASGSESQQSSYGGLIDSLRRAVAHDWRNGVRQAQWGDHNGIIQLTLTHAEQGTLTLWIQPQNLYVLGFTNRDGDTWAFQDEGNNLFGRLRAMNINPGTERTLNFGGNYSSLSQAAGRGREAMSISYNDFWGSFSNLVSTTDPTGGAQQNVARSLMFMIQYTSEAGRFNDVYNLMSRITRSSQETQDGLSNFQQNLENNWAAISLYGARVTNDPTTPAQDIPQVANLSSFNDVSRLLAVAISQSWSRTDTGAYDRSEL